MELEDNMDDLGPCASAAAEANNLVEPFLEEDNHAALVAENEVVVASP